jgi:UDP-N-acetylglucosamine acyltransferase
VPEVHPTATVALGATVGADVCIGPWCHVGPDVVLEAGARLVSHVVVDGLTRIGEGAVLWPFCSVGLPPQDLKYRGEPTRTEIGAGTQVREHCTIHRGTVTGAGVTRVGAGCLLMAVVHVAHDCAVGDRVIIANNVVMGGHVEIGADAVIGGAVALHQFVRIGRGAMIGGMSGVIADVIPFGTVTGIGRECRLSGLNVIGLQRRGYGRDRMHRVRAAVQALFGADGVLAERLARVRAEYGDDELVTEILAFVDSTGRRRLLRSAVGKDHDED